jgi:transposase-like protein
MERKARTAVEPGSGRRWTEDEARAALAELAQSRESVAAFTQSRGYSAQRIRYWKKRLGETGAVPAFVSVPWPAGAPTSSGPRMMDDN